jgi:hypothetical protein
MVGTNFIHPSTKNKPDAASDLKDLLTRPTLFAVTVMGMAGAAEFWWDLLDPEACGEVF